MMLIACHAPAVMCTVTVSGAAESQSLDKQGFHIIQKNSFIQKNLLFILAQATGDPTITNQPTKIYYDPDAYNINLTQWLSVQDGDTNSYFGIFYYSNSVAGLVQLDGTDGLGQYYSYMEFDYQNTLIGNAREGFWNPAGMEANSAYTENHNGESFAGDGNAILYIHNDPSKFNLLGNWDGSVAGYPSAFYFANDAYNNSFQQSYAVVLHGTVSSKISFSLSKSAELESESFTLKGSGDINYNHADGTMTGTVTITGKGPAEF